MTGLLDDGHLRPPEHRPLVSSLGHVYDHIALSVADFAAWVAKLRSERVTFLEEPGPAGRLPMRYARFFLRQPPRRRCWGGRTS